MEPSANTKCLATTWASYFEPAGPSGPPQEWISLHSKSVIYNDHAFRVQRKGLEGATHHFGQWKTAIPNFKMEVKDIWPELKLPGKRRLTFEIIGSGTFSNDLSKEYKPSGKSFRYEGRVDLTINDENGLIDRIDEYYPLQFDSGNSLADYRMRQEDK